HLAELPDTLRPTVQNNGGGDYNHRLFWDIMAPPSQEDNAPNGELALALTQKWGSVDAFKTAFETAAKTRFGSGWAWLSVTPSGELTVSSTPNQDSPLMTGHTPVLGLDVWEHAYYLTYQNRRPDYVGAFWKVVNWERVAQRVTAALATA
ncbi:superoxide dismutase, partial [bacterium]|nr:superoxide dismutase [bacterium]